MTKLKGAYISLIIGRRGFGCEDELWEILCPKSFTGFRFDLGSLLQGGMWALVLIMDYISLIVGHRGFGSKYDLREIICPESYAGVTFDLGPLLQGQVWSLIPIMA